MESHVTHVGLDLTHISEASLEPLVLLFLPSKDWDSI